MFVFKSMFFHSFSFYGETEDVSNHWHKVDAYQSLYSVLLVRSLSSRQFLTVKWFCEVWISKLCFCLFVCSLWPARQTNNSILWPSEDWPIYKQVIEHLNVMKEQQAMVCAIISCFTFCMFFRKLNQNFGAFNTYQVTIELKRTNGAKIQTPVGDCYVYRADLTTLLPGE